MPVQMIELQEVQMLEISDDALESSGGGGTGSAFWSMCSECG